MTFSQKFKRFFEPIVHDPKTYIQCTFEWILDGLFFIASLYFFEIIGQTIHLSQTEEFYNAIFLFGAISLSYFLIKILVIHWGWVNIYVSIDTFASKRYLSAFIAGEPNAVEKIWTGRFLQVYRSWTRLWMEMIHGFLSTDLALILSSIYGIIRVSQFNIYYGFLFISTLVILLLVTYYTDKRYTVPYRKRRVEIESDYGRLLARVFMSKMEYMQNHEFPKELTRIASMLQNIRTQNHHIDNTVWWMYIVVRVLGFLFRLGVYVFVGRAVLEGTASFWLLSLYIMIVSTIEMTMRTVYDSFRRFTRDGQQIEKLWSTFDSLTPIKWYDSGNTFTPDHKNIEIKNISYGYTESKVFENFSLTIEKGKKTALVWASGGGKTTLIKLIAGYLHPESGSISVLGNPLGTTALKTYYPHIGYLTQDPSVFDGTIRENLISAVANTDVLSSRTNVRDPFQNHIWEKNKENLLSARKRDLPTRSILTTSLTRNDKIQDANKIQDVELEQKLTQALKLAHCDFVFELEKGLDTEIGERGVRLSWWQKQRLAIAKIFLKDPEIILLDEPTSALDSFSEEKITEALNTLFEWRTVIIVAHRLQTVKKADDIIVIEWGSVVERGTHTTLVEQGGIYARMLELQSGF